MSEEELELLITTDDPGEDTLEEDTFHLKAENTGQPFPTRRRYNKRTDVQWIVRSSPSLHWSSSSRCVDRESAT